MNPQQAQEKPRKRRGKQKEGAVVNACIRWLYAYGCYVWRNNTGSYKTESGQHVSYGKKGSADIIGIMPDGRFIAIECKYGKNDLSACQEEFRDRILEKGGVFITARSIDDLEAAWAQL